MYHVRYNGDWRDALLNDVSFRNGLTSEWRPVLKEGDFYRLNGGWEPLLRFPDLPFGIVLNGSTMHTWHSYNGDVLTDNPVWVGIGSSTMANFNLSSPNGYGHRINTRINLIGIGTKSFTNLGLGGQSTADLVPTANGGDPTRNVDAAIALGARFIICDEPTNWAAEFDENQQITNYLLIRNKCWSMGIFVWFNGSRPRTPYTTEQKRRLKAFDALLRKHPILKYHSYPCYYDFADPGNTDNLNPVYDQGDGIHLMANGTQLLEENSYAKQTYILKTRTAYVDYELHRSPIGLNTYSLFDTITDINIIDKSYTKLSGDYKVRATLKDGSKLSFSNVIQITNQSPTVNAGDDQEITLPTSSVSLEAVANDPDGSIASYAWTKQSGGAATITSPSSANTTVTDLVEGTYVFRITVTDNEGITAQDDVTIIVNPVGNIPPTADAGSDQSILLPTNSVSLSGSGSTDGDGTIVSYAWSQISGPNTATLTAASSVNTDAEDLIEGVYVFELLVTDNDGSTDTDTVQVTVSPASFIEAKFNFNRTAQSVVDWIDVSGVFHTTQIDSSTYPGTTIFIRTKPTNASAVNIWGNTSGDSSNNSVGQTTGNNSGAVPDNVLISNGFTTGQTYAAGNEQIEIRGLTPGAVYTVKGIGSRISSAVAQPTRLMDWTCVDANGTETIENYNVKGNTSTFAEFIGKVADANGVIKIAINRPTPTDANHNFGYCNGLIVLRTA